MPSKYDSCWTEGLRLCWGRHSMIGLKEIKKIENDDS
jgi:hypothetical protein